MSHLTKEEASRVEELVDIIVHTAAPAILKAVAASRPGVKMVGELMVTEPVRDYRKELWIAALTAAIPITVGASFSAQSVADKALVMFDERFPK